MRGKILATSADSTILNQQPTQKYLENTCEVIRKTVSTPGNVCKAIGILQDPEALKELHQIAKAVLQDGVTVIAIDKNADKVIGICINKILVKSEPFYENFHNIFEKTGPRQIIEFIIATDKICYIFEHCEVNTLMESLFLGILPEYQRRGIGKKLLEISVDLAQKLYCGLDVKQSLDGKKLSLEPVSEIVLGISTSFISLKISRALGFEIAAEESYTNLEMMGKVFEKFSLETDKMYVLYKRLSKTE